MYCKQCGANQKETARFCTNCGTSLEKDENVTMCESGGESTAQKTPNRKGLLLSLGIGATALVAVLVCLLVSGHINSSQKVIDALSDGEYEEALSYVSEMEEIDNRLVDKLTERLQTIYAEYKAGTTEYEVAEMELNTIQKMRHKSDELSSAFVDVRNAISALRDSRTAFKSGVEHLDKGNYKEAIKQFKLVIEEDDQYSTALQKLETAVVAYRKDVLATADKAAQKNDYRSALSTLQTALFVLDKDEEITQRISIIYKSYEKGCLVAATGYAKNKDYTNVFLCLKEAMNILEDDTAVEEALKSYRKEFETHTISQVDSLLNNKLFDDAEKLLNEALELLPDNTVFIEKRDSVADLRPVGLDTVTVIDASDGMYTGYYRYKSDPFTDSFGNVYNGVHWYADVYEERYSIHNLNKEYTTFSGSIVAAPHTQTGRTYSVRIYADDKLVYSLDGFTKTTGKVDFSVDIKYATLLTIKIVDDQSMGHYDCNIGIVNAELSK